MRGFLLWLLLLMPSGVEAARVSKPPVIVEWTPDTFAQLNSFLDSLWNLTNGRYSVDVTTTNPNGNRQGQAGDMVLYNNAGSYKACFNVSTGTGGKTWRCSANALTAP